MDEYINREALSLKVKRHLMPNVDADGTVSVEDAERYFLKLLESYERIGGEVMRGLNKLFYIKKEIESLQMEIKNLPEISGLNMSGMPSSGGVSDPVYNLIVKKEKLIEKLNKKIERYFDELARVETIIDSIDDLEVRTIARLRYVHFMKWEKIGEAVHMDRTICSRKLRKYIGNMEFSNLEMLHTTSH